MKRILLGILLAIALSVSAVLVSGCHGLGETAAERSNDHSRIIRLNGSMLIDDIDAIFQMDHPSRVTEYSVR
jgi:hypothetical protein